MLSYMLHYRRRDIKLYFVKFALLDGPNAYWNLILVGLIIKISFSAAFMKQIMNYVKQIRTQIYKPFQKACMTKFDVLYV